MGWISFPSYGVWQEHSQGGRCRVGRLSDVKTYTLWCALANVLEPQQTPCGCSVSGQRPCHVCNGKHHLIRKQMFGQRSKGQRGVSSDTCSLVKLLLLRRMQLLLLDLLYSKKKPGHLTRPPACSLGLSYKATAGEESRLLPIFFCKLKGVWPLDSYSHSRGNIWMADCDENLNWY